jgi:hypothetical protein
MKTGKRCLIVAGAFVAMQLATGTAQAQLMDAIKGKLGGGSSSSQDSSSGTMGSLGSALSLPSLSSGSSSNVAGVLQFCVKNNYLNADAASSVKDKLLGKISGGKTPTSDSGYSDGASGILNTGDGKKLDLTGGGLKEEITRKACDKILSQGKSML